MNLKRLFVVTAAAVAVWASGVAAQTMCLYPSGACWGATVADCNESWGWVHNGGTQGEGTYCSGGTYDQAATTNRKNTPLLTPGMTLKGCCQWASTGEYTNVYMDQEVTDCSGGMNTYWAGADCGDGLRPSGTPTYNGGAQTQLGYCRWADPLTNPNNSCYPVTAAAEAADCQTGSNTYWAGSTHTGSPACPTTTPTYDGSGIVNVGMCKWAANNPAGNCWPVTAEEALDCGTGANTYWAGITTGGPACPTTTPTYDGGSSMLGYCKWALTGECWPVTADAEVADCIGDNIFYTVAGAPIECTNPASSIKHLGSKNQTNSAIRASYTKGRVGVNWNTTSKIASGTVSLINAKGVTVASSRAKISGGRVSANLGAKAVPAGMYFIRINAKDASGKQIIQQTPVSVVK